MNVTGFSIAVAVYLLAGCVKGTLGLGLPTTAVSLLAQFGDARSAIALVLIPMIVTNLWQVYRSGRLLESLQRYRLLVLSEMLVIGIVSQHATAIAAPALSAVLGAVIVLFAVVNLWRSPPALPDRYDSAAQLLTGCAAGVMGGITGIWAPAIVIYLAARRLDTEDFVRATGLLLMVGSVVLFTGYWRAGIVTPDIARQSAFLVLPALLGFAIGERLRQRLSGPRFRQFVLLFFLLMGLNLIRRACGSG